MRAYAVTDGQVILFTDMKAVTCDFAAIWDDILDIPHLPLS
jgi:hypothetical protein